MSAPMKSHYFCVFCDTIAMSSEEMGDHSMQHLMAIEGQAVEDRAATDTELGFVDRLLAYQRRLNECLPHELPPEDTTRTLMIGCPVCDAMIRCHDLRIDERFRHSIHATEATAHHQSDNDSNQRSESTSGSPKYTISHLRGESLAAQREHIYHHLNYFPFVCNYSTATTADDNPIATDCHQKLFAYEACKEHLRVRHCLPVTAKDEYEVVSEHMHFHELRPLEELIRDHLNCKPMPALSAYVCDTTIDVDEDEYGSDMPAPPPISSFDELSDTSGSAGDDENEATVGHEFKGHRKRRQTLHPSKYYDNNNGHHFDDSLSGFSDSLKKERSSQTLTTNSSADDVQSVNNRSADDLSVDLTHKRHYKNWFTETERKKYPYFPQKDDDVYYLPYGHELYRTEVLLRGVYGLANKHYAMKHFRYDRILAKVAKIDFLFKEHRLDHTVVRCIYVTLRPYDPKYGTIIHVKYHDMDGVVDFMVLREHYEHAVAKGWDVGEEFRSIVDDKYWFGVVIGFNTADFCHETQFKAIRVQWYSNSAVDYVSPWDLEPVDPFVTYNKFSYVPVTGEDRAMFFESVPDEWPHYDEARELRRVATGLKVILAMDKTKEFSILDDLSASRYRDKILYPVDMKTFIARVENGFYRRHLAIKYDLKFMEANVRKLVKSVRRDPDYQFDELIAKRLKYHTKFVTALCLLFIDTHDCKNPYDLYPNIDEYLETHDVKCYSAKRVHLNLVKKHPNLLPARQKRPARPQSFGDSRKAIKIYRALKNTHSSAATGSPRAGSSGGRARTVSASSQSRSACGGGGRARTVSTDSRVYRKPTPKSRREAEDKRRRTSTPKAKKSANNTLAMSTNVSADEVVVDGVVHSMLDAVLTDDNMSQESNTGANKDSQEPAMYSSDVSISENEYNFCEFSVSSDDSDTDKDFKPSVYYKNKIKIPHLEEYQKIFQNTGN